jgi:hypothetical protein
MTTTNSNTNELNYVSQRLNSIDLDLGYLLRRLDDSDAAILEHILSDIKQVNDRIKSLAQSLNKDNGHTNTSDIDLPSTQNPWID